MSDREDSCYLENLDLLEVFIINSEQPEIYNYLGPIILGHLILLGIFIHLFRMKRHKNLMFNRVKQEGEIKWISKEIIVSGYWALKPFAMILVSLGVSANLISFFGLGLGLLSGVAFASGHFGFGSVFLIVSGILDVLDGMVARISGSSLSGAVLDSALDRYVEFFILSGLVIHYRDQPVIMFICLFALVGSFMVSFSTAQAEAVKLKLKRRGLKRLERMVILGFGALIAPLSVRWFEGDLGVPYKTGIPMVVAVSIIAALSNFSALFRLKEVQDHIKSKDPNLGGNFVAKNQ